jgi:hypothetical protein
VLAADIAVTATVEHADADDGAVTAPAAGVNTNGGGDQTRRAGRRS